MKEQSVAFTCAPLHSRYRSDIKPISKHKGSCYVATLVAFFNNLFQQYSIMEYQVTLRIVLVHSPISLLLSLVEPSLSGSFTLTSVN